jgi:hypothetical protein
MKPGQRSSVDLTMEDVEVMQSGVKVRGHNPRFKHRDELIDKVVDDLPEILSIVAHHYAQIKRIINPSGSYDLDSLALRERRNVYL